MATFFDSSLLGLMPKYSSLDTLKVENKIEFPDKIYTAVSSGFGQKANDSEIVFAFDKDTYVLNKKETGESAVVSVLDELHCKNSEIFENLITDELRQKMGVQND